MDTIQNSNPVGLGHQPHLFLVLKDNEAGHFLVNCSVVLCRAFNSVSGSLRELAVCPQVLCFTALLERWHEAVKRFPTGSILRVKYSKVRMLRSETW